MEGHRVGTRFLDLDVGAAGQGADMSENGVDTLVRPCDGAIDPFTGQKQSAAHARLFHTRRQIGLDGRGIVKSRELVERGNADRSRGGFGFHGAAFSSLFSRLHPRLSPILLVQFARLWTYPAISIVQCVDPFHLFIRQGERDR